MIKLNDWPLKNLLVLAGSLLLASAGLVGLASSGLDVPVLRQVAGFIFLTFIPGALILRMLRIHNIGATEGLVYSVGLSVAFLMFSGAFINFLLPLIGITQPITLLPVTTSISVLILILMAIAFIRDRSFAGLERTIPAEKLQLPPVLLLVLLLLMTILGAALIYSYQNNILLLVCLIAVAGLFVLAAFGKFIQPRLYPFAIFIIGLCLLYQTTLMSPYLVGQDIYIEYDYYRLVANAGLWDAAIPNTINSCLSINILAPVYSLVLGIDGLWTFKAIYPLFFALVPLILFLIFKQQMSPKKAFLSAFFFVAVPTFSLEMIALCRQQVAELFFVLVILLLVERSLGLRQKLTLISVFAMSIVVSHYALGFFGFIYMGLLLPLAFIIRSNVLQKAWSWLVGKLGGLPPDMKRTQALPAIVLITLAAVYFLFGFAWYGTVASGVNLDILSGLCTWQTAGITDGLVKLIPGLTGSVAPGEPPVFLQFSRRDELIQTALGLDFAQATPVGQGFRILQYVTQLFMIIGCFRLVLRPRYLRFTAEYIALSVISALLLLACIFVPYFADSLNTTRIYHIALITLAPFCILGGEAVWLGVKSLWQGITGLMRGATAINQAHPTDQACIEDNPGAMKFIALAILVPYFLFTSGIIYEVTGQSFAYKVESPYSIALSSYRLDLAGVFYRQDDAAARWLAQNTDDTTVVYVDYHTDKFLKFREVPGKVFQLTQDAGKLPDNSLIFLKTWNTTKNKLTFIVAAGAGLRQYFSVDDVFGQKGLTDINRIYCNGGAQAFLQYR